jgi:CBS domain-containing protein
MGAIAMSVRNLLGSKGNFVPIIRSNSTLADVVEILEADEAGALVVTDDERTILGLITERDVARALSTYGSGVLNIPVADVMTRDVVTCDFGQPISSILELMHEHQIEHVPITQDGKLRGIINMLDLVKYRLGELEMEARALKDYVVGRS